MESAIRVDLTVRKKPPNNQWMASLSPIPFVGYKQRGESQGNMVATAMQPFP